MRACALAGVLADLFAAKAAFFYLATPGTPEMDQKTQLYTCAGMYLGSLHLFDVSNFLYKTAVSRLGLWAENTSTPETTRAATSDPLDHNFPSDHWKMEDYEIDPVKFKLVPKRSGRGAGVTRCRDAAPCAAAGGSPQRARSAAGSRATRARRATPRRAAGGFSERKDAGSMHLVATQQLHWRIGAC